MLITTAMTIMSTTTITITSISSIAITTNNMIYYLFLFFFGALCRGREQHMQLKGFPISGWKDRNYFGGNL